MCLYSETKMHPVPFNGCHFSRWFRPITENNKYTSESHLPNRNSTKSLLSDLSYFFSLHPCQYHSYYSKVDNYSDLSFVYLTRTESALTKQHRNTPCRGRMWKEHIFQGVKLLPIMLPWASEAAFNSYLFNTFHLQLILSILDAENSILHTPVNTVILRITLTSL